MPHRHEFRPTMTSTLSLPDLRGFYDVFMAFRCVCGVGRHCTAWVHAKTPQLTCAELLAIERRQGRRVR